MGSKGSTTQQTQQSSVYQPSPQITGAGTQALQGAQAASQQPFWLPQQPVAGFSPDQLAAFQNVRNVQGMTAPWFGQAGNLALSSATPLTGEQIGNFYNPMAQNVTNQLQNIFGQQMRNTTGQATQAAGGVGADRIGVAQANLANQQGLAAGQTYSQLYQQALNAAMQNQQMQANAAYAMGNLGAGAQGAALQGSQALLGVGGLQQQLAQARLMSPYAWLGQQFAYPYQANQYLAGITGAMIPAFPSTTTGQGTTTTTPAQPSLISQGLGLGMAGLGAYQSGAFSGMGKGTNAGTIGGTNPFTGSASAIYRHGGAVQGMADGGTPKAPSIPQMTAGTQDDMDRYFSDINQQASNLSSMSRFAMQPTGTGGWRSPFTPSTPAPQQQSNDLSNILNMFGMGKGSGWSKFAKGGGTDDGGIGDDPFGSTDSFVPNVHLTMSNFHGPDLPKMSAPQQQSSSGKGSGLGQAVGVAAQVLPFLMAARGGAVSHGGGVMPHLAYQGFAGDDGMTDIADFPFTPPDSTPLAPSPEDLRPNIPPPMPGLRDPFGGGVPKGQYATPQEAEQARISQALEKRKNLRDFSPDFNLETAGAAAPTPASPNRPFGGLPAMAEVPIPEEPGRAPVTPVERGNLPMANMNPFELPPATGGRPSPEEAAAFRSPLPPDQLALDEAQRRQIAGPFQPPPSAIPSPQEAAAFQPQVAPRMPPPRPDIAGPPGQAFAPGAPPVPPVSRQSVAQDTLYFANKYGIPPQIALRLVNRESGFNPNARGAAGEVGAAQLMPGTAKDLGVNPFDTRQNVEGGMRYLKQQYDRFGNWPQAIAAYNAGPGAVASGRIPASTRAYVADVAGGGGAPDVTQLSANAIKPTGGDVGAEPGAPMPTGGEFTAARYTQPTAAQPFPQAGPKAPGADLARNPLLMAGLRIAAGTSPWAGVNIGAGASQALEAQRKEAREEMSINQHAQQLYQQMQQHIDTMTKLTPAQEAAGWKQMYDLTKGTPILFNPRNQQAYAFQNGRFVPVDSSSMQLGEQPPTTAPVPGSQVAPGVAPVTETPKPPGTTGGYNDVSPQMVQEFGNKPQFTPQGRRQTDVEDAIKKIQDAKIAAADAVRSTEFSVSDIEKNADKANSAIAGASGIGPFLLGPGTGANYRHAVASAIRTYGGDEAAKRLGIDPEAIGAITAIQKDTVRLGQAQTRLLGAREAAQIVEQSIRANPGWEQTEEGRIHVKNSVKMALQREKDYQAFANKYQQMNNGDLRGVQEAFDKYNPAERYIERADKLSQYELRTDTLPVDARKKVFAMPKSQQMEMYDNLPILMANRNNPKVVEAFDKHYGGLSGVFLGGAP